MLRSDAKRLSEAANSYLGAVVTLRGVFCIYNYFSRTHVHGKTTPNFKNRRYSNVDGLVFTSQTLLMLRSKARWLGEAANRGEGTVVRSWVVVHIHNYFSHTHVCEGHTKVKLKNLQTLERGWTRIHFVDTHARGNMPWRDGRIGDIRCAV